MATLRKSSTLPSELVNPPPSPFTKLRADDLLVEILIRLPTPRTACRCKAVCKRWNSLIFSPYFNRRFISHYQTIKDDPPLLLRSDDHPETSTILSFLPVPEQGRGRFAVLDSFKDLLLCGFVDRIYVDNELGRSYLVCNPITKQWIALPLAPEKEGAHGRAYIKYVHARLVCQPRHNYNLQLGDGQVCVHSDYRFRVVCVYATFEPVATLKLDVYCSESGEWTKDALVLAGRLRKIRPNSLSCNGELFWWFHYTGVPGYPMVAFNPFCLEMPPTVIDTSSIPQPESELREWIASVSQDALHIIVAEAKRAPIIYSRNAFTVWRLEEDGKSWRKLYEMWLSETSWSDYDLEYIQVRNLHPEKPEIIFLQSFGHRYGYAILSCNLRTGELEFLGPLGQCLVPFVSFQPGLSSCPISIPRYKELRAVYDGSYNCLVQTVEATPIIGITSASANLPLISQI
ncbi:unnamed protein product [Linum tenue]|uniref:F-box domain-containing protein n=1 Tax=Linum tenue TaxID=586396 RepID=A0AAV0KK21_9ROSI|nr:unnamed protein product [Linum tenue]